MPGVSVTIGEWVALGCAFLWAINGLILRTQLAAMSPAAMNGFRCGVAGLAFLLFLPFHEPSIPLPQIPAAYWGLLLGSVVLGLVIGDTCYLTALRETGLARALALSGTFPLSTMVFEYALLGRAVSAHLAAGAVLVVIGVACLSGRHADAGGGAIPRLRLGVALALLASLVWGLGTVLLRPPMEHFTPVQANALRMPLVAALLYGLRVWPSGERLGRVPRRALVLVGATGLLGMGVGSYMFLFALQAIGPTKTVTLASTSPVFGLALGALFLGERLTARLTAGTAACLAGVWLVL